YLARLFDYCLAAQAGVELQVGRHVKPVGFIVFQFAQQLRAFHHVYMAGGASVVASASMVQKNAVVERNIKKRLGLAVVFVLQFPVLEFHGLVFRLECYPDCIGAGSFLSCGSAAVIFLVGHNSLKIQSFVISAGAIGCEAAGPPWSSVLSMF